MRKVKLLQFSLIGTAVFSTLLLAHTSFDSVRLHYFLHYFLLVLLPLSIAIIIQLFDIREKYAEMKKCLEIYDRCIEKRPLCAGKFPGYIHTVAGLRSSGINPCRAGPYHGIYLTV